MTDTNNTQNDNANDNAIEQNHAPANQNNDASKSNSGKAAIIPVLLGLGISVGIIGIAVNQAKNAVKQNQANANSTSGLMSLPSNTNQSSGKNKEKACFNQPKPVSDEDLRIAKIAWKYFENNYQEDTGMVNAANKYPSTTTWDTGSALFGIIAAHDLGLISDKRFDDMVVSLISTMRQLTLFDKRLPNKVYHSKTGEMVDYKNQKTADGIGVSILDSARIISAFNLLASSHPKYTHAVQSVVDKWDFSESFKKQQMYGHTLDKTTKKAKPLQEGRLGYEQYAAGIFDSSDMPVSVSRSYNNKHRRNVEIYDQKVPYDVRDPRVLGAYNYVVTESFVLDMIENPSNPTTKKMMDIIYNVQKQRYEHEGIVTAVSEDNIDRKPRFIYNTIFAAGLRWNTITDRGVMYNHLKTTSTKAAFSMIAVKPDDGYSLVLRDAVISAYDEDAGWFSGVYENGLGYNKAKTANTNGIILETIMYKRYGSFGDEINRCGTRMKINNT